MNSEVFCCYSFNHCRYFYSAF